MRMQVTNADDSLTLVRDFVNTIDLEDRRDEISTPAQLREWLAGKGLASPALRITPAEHLDALAVREALRALLLANNDVEVDVDAAAAALDGAARRARVSLRFDPSGAQLEPHAAGGAGALGRLLVAAADAMASERWTRLKACRWDTCGWAFYDRAKNHSRAWCSMKVCGNRQKARLYRERHAR
jgi:predicted RNA-binding Zn ribbon-like protein